MQEATSNELFGIAKKINHELEDLPLHQHSAIVEMVRVGMQVRAIAFERKEKEEQMDLQRRQIAAREQQIALETRALERAAAADMSATIAKSQGPQLVAQPEAEQVEAQV